MMIKMMNGDNVKVSHVTVDDDIGSYWSMYRMVMAIIYIYYDKVYLCQKNCALSQVVSRRGFSRFIFTFSSGVSSKPLRKSSDVPTQTVIRLHDQLLL